MIKLHRVIADGAARLARSLIAWAQCGARAIEGPEQRAAQPVDPVSLSTEAKAAKLLEANEQLILRMLRVQLEAEAAAHQLNKLSRLAEHDALTELPNRVLLLDRLRHAIAVAKRHGGRLALLFVDLNGFKQINDTYGHRVGDEVLKLVGRRLASAVRQADTVGRYGGDEFLILLSEVSQVSDASLIADKLAGALREPSRVGDHVFHLSAGIGIGIYPDDSLDPDELIAIADAAMYVAKRQGIGNHDDHVVHTGEHPDEARLPRQLTSHELALARYEERHDRLQAANELLSRALEQSERLQATAESTKRRQTEFIAALAQDMLTPLAPVPQTAVIVDPGRDGPMPAIRAGDKPGAGARKSPRDTTAAEARAEQAALNGHDVEMADIIAKAVLACKPSLAARHQRLSVDIPSRPLGVHGDPLRLARSLRGLLENASRSAPMGGEIVVSAAVADDALQVTIVESGQAVDTLAHHTAVEPTAVGPSAVGQSAAEPSAAEPSVAEPSVAEPSVAEPSVAEPSVAEPSVAEPVLNGWNLSDRDNEPGLTLALVRRLVEEHGGRLVARGGSTGYGSEFVLTLPLSGPPASHSPT